MKLGNLRERAAELVEANGPMKDALEGVNVGDVHVERGIQCVSTLEFIGNIGLFFLIGLVVVCMFGLIFRFAGFREFLSPMYRSANLAVDLTEDYAKLRKTGAFSMRLDVAIFLGLVTVGFLHFAGSIFSGLIELFGKIIQTAPLC